MGILRLDGGIGRSLCYSSYLELLSMKYLLRWRDVLSQCRTQGWAAAPAAHAGSAGGEVHRERSSSSRPSA